MTVTVRCPFCGAEQRGLFLDETNGRFICSKCQKECQVPQPVEAGKASSGENDK